MIGFNPSNFCTLLYGSTTYCDISIFPYLGYWKMTYVRLLILIRFLKCTDILSCILYVCGLRIFIFKFFSSINICLRRLIESQSAMNRLFNIMSYHKTSCTGLVYRILWYMFCTAKSLSANIPDQGSSLSR